MEKGIEDLYAKQNEERRRREEVAGKIRKGIRDGEISIDENRVSEIAEELKKTGVGAGDELRNRALEIYIEELVDRELGN